MFKKLLLPAVILFVLLPLHTYAQTTTTTAGQDNPGTTGQQSGPNDAGGHAKAPGTTDSNSAGVPKGMNFDEMDTDKDGKLDEDELNRYGSNAAGAETKGAEGQGKRLLKLYDHNDDGFVTREELKEGLDKASDR